MYTTDSNSNAVCWDFENVVVKNFGPTGKVRILIRILPVSTSTDPHFTPGLSYFGRKFLQFTLPYKIPTFPTLPRYIVHQYDPVWH